jgi:glucokinase
VTDGSLAIGVDVGGTKILAGLVDREGQILRRHERPTDTSSQEAVVSELNAAVDELRDDDVVAVGFGIPAPIDQEGGRVVHSVNIPLSDYPLRDRMRDRCALPVGLENDANAAAIGEWKVGAGRGVSDMVMLTLGTGVGGGLILDGRPFHGKTGAGAELGHIVVDASGPVCTCGGHGHLEALCAGHAADRVARELFGPAVDAHRLVHLADEGEEGAVDALASIGRHLGIAMGSCVNIFNPELIVVGGGFGVAAWKYLIPTAEETMRREALVPARDQVRVAPAELGSAAGLVGAAFVAFEALDGTP